MIEEKQENKHVWERINGLWKCIVCDNAIPTFEEGIEYGLEKSRLELQDVIWRKIDWIKLLSKAIENRKTSWNKEPVKEWRNASDEIRSALVNELEKLKVLENPLERARKTLELSGDEK